MKVIKPLTLSLLTRPFEFKREFWLGTAVIAFLPLGDTPVLLPETAMWPFLAEELPPDQPLDAAIPKGQQEFLAIAHCFAPDGIAAPLVRTGIQCGPLIKLLDVHGDRDFDQRARSVSAAVPFKQMALDWTHTYGGAEFAENPLGKGITPANGSDGQIIPVQNVVNPKLGRDGARVPAAYGAIDQTWPARARRAGTYGDDWLKQDFPGFARDIDWRFFNLAPQDQWLPEPLVGNEAYAFKNLHPNQRLLKGRLPGMAPRLFIVRKQPGEAGGFEEVPLSLTTVWFFPHRERLVVVYHGRARLVEEDAADVARVVIGADQIGALRPVEHYRTVMVNRADSKDRMYYALRDEDLVPREWLQQAGVTAAVDAEHAPGQLALQRAQQSADKQRAALLEQLKGLNLDPAKYAPPPLQIARPVPTLEELPAFVAAARADADAKIAQAKAKAAAGKAEAEKRLAASGMSAEEIQQRLDPKPKGPPKFNAATQRDQLAGQIAALRAKGNLTAEHEDKLASLEAIAQFEETQETVRNGYRLMAHNQDPADALSVEQSAEIQRLVSRDTAAARALYDLHGADLSGRDLSGIDLSGVTLDGANLTGTSFAGAKLINAVLAHARMQGCVLDGADLSGANLGKAKLTDATLRKAVLKKCVLAGADLTNASFAEANLEGADLSDAVTDGTDFSAVHAPGILAIKLSLPGIRAAGIVLTKAKFIECNLQGADLTAAMLDRAVFLQCNLVGIRLGRARLRKAVFVKQCSLLGANLAGADLTEANLRETNLRGANLNTAIIQQADLSGADLSNASMRFVRGNSSRLVGADLRCADLRLSDFAKADLARADLRGANLTGMSAYEANLPRAKLDKETRRGGMFRKRMRYLPIYEPPQEAEA